MSWDQYGAVAADLKVVLCCDCSVVRYPPRDQVSAAATLGLLNNLASISLVSQ